MFKQSPFEIGRAIGQALSKNIQPIVIFVGSAIRSFHTVASHAAGHGHLTTRIVAGLCLADFAANFFVRHGSPPLPADYESMPSVKLDDKFEFDEPSRPLIEGRHYYSVHNWIIEKGRGTVTNRHGDVYTVRANDLNHSCNGYLETNEIISARLISTTEMEDVIVEEGPRAYPAVAVVSSFQ